MNAPSRILLAALIALAAFLRFCGMSHDLHEGYLYHPDAPKQVRAIQQFYSGVYYQHIGLKDYDGYPLLHAHLVEYILRIVEPIRQAALEILGLDPTPDGLLETSALYWILLLMNAALSTLTVLIVFKAARESIGPAAGWAAGALMALSPTDITSTHMATGDAATAFFAAWSLLYSLRVYRLGRYRDYIAAGITAIFAFAAKYYAATCFITLGIAHLARCNSWKPADWFRNGAWKKIVVAVLATLAGLFLAIPSLFTDFSAQMKDIAQAMVVSTQRFPPELATANRWAKFLYSMDANLPDLIRSITPVAVLAAIAAFATRLRRDLRLPILLVSPLLYVLMAVGSRGPVNPVYHTAITPALFLTLALCMDHLARQSRQKKLVAAVLWIAAVAFMLPDTEREVFFAAHMDTRRMADRWSAENIPQTFVGQMGRYTFTRAISAEALSQPDGMFVAGSKLDPVHLKRKDTRIDLKTFALERHPLTQFRNVDQSLVVDNSPWIRLGYSNPSPLRAPARTQNQFIFTGGAEFARSERVLDLPLHALIKRRIVSPQPLTNIWVIATTMNPPTRIKLNFAGQKLKLRTDASGSGFLVITNPAAKFPSRDDLRFYPVEFRAYDIPTRVTLATTPGEAGRALASLSRPADALPLLIRAALADHDESAAVLALANARDAGLSIPAAESEALAKIAGPALDVHNDESLFDAYGIRANYIQSLPFFTFDSSSLAVTNLVSTPIAMRPSFSLSANELVPNLRADRDAPTRPDFYAGAEHLLLEAGSYIVEFRVRNPSRSSDQFRVEFLAENRAGQSLAHQTRAVELQGDCDFQSLEFRFEMPVAGALRRIGLQFSGDPVMTIGGMEIRPDVTANATRYAAQARAYLVAARSDTK